jgi:hypothetical protein
MGTKKGQKRKTARRAYMKKESAPAGLFYHKAFRAGWRPTFRWKPFGIRWRMKK